MAGALKARLVSIHAKTERQTTDLQIEIVGMLDNAELEYLQVGAGGSEVYAILPDDRELSRLGEIVVDCDAIVSGSVQLFVENFEMIEAEEGWAERVLRECLINYDIPLEGFSGALLGICGQCGGVGRHVGPPCLQKITSEQDAK